MEITGRLTADAAVRPVNDNRQVVNFDIAINDSYRTKDGDTKKLTTYVQCAYWLGSEVARYLTKGTVVSLSGRIGVNAYTNMQGEAVGKLTFHANSIRLFGAGKSNGAPLATTPQQPAAAANDIDDLPF